MKRYIMDMKLLLNILSNIFRQSFGIVDYDMDYRIVKDLGMDDIDIIELSIIIEESFNICFSDAEIIKWDTITVDELVKSIHGKIIKKGEKPNATD